MSTALVDVKNQAPAVAQQQPAAPVYFPLTELERMADAIAKGGLFGWKTKEQALSMMLVAQAEGEHPATVAQDYDLIQGKPTRKTHSVLARFLKSGGVLEWTDFTDARVAGVFSHPRGVQTPVEVAWTLDMARTAGLIGKDNWKGYSRAMLRARVIAEGVRLTYPAAIGGMLITEEARGLALIDGETGEIIEQPKAKEPLRAKRPEGASEDQSSQSSSTEGPKPASAPTQPGCLTEGMLTTIRGKIRSANEMVGLTEEKVCKHFEVDALEAIPRAKVNDVLQFVANPG